MIWNPIVPTGFRILVDDDFNFISFIEEPPGNTKTFDEIKTENIGKAVAPKTPLTQKQIDDAIRADYINTNNVEEIP